MRVLELALVLAVVGTSSIARADEPAASAEDQATDAVPRVHIKLTDGSEYTGELVEKVPQDHVTLKLDDGSLKRVEWASLELKRAPPAPPPPPSHRLAPDVAHVTLAADSAGAELQRKAGQTTVITYMATPHGPMGQAQDQDIWQTVCAAPCDADVDPTQIYRVGGDGIVGSSAFHLTAGNHSLTADTGSSLKRGFGWTFTVVGGISLLIGVLVLAVTPRTLPNCTINGCTQIDQSSSIYAVSLPFIGAGVVGFGVGLWMVLSAKTHVTLDGGGADAARVRIGPLEIGAGGLVF